MEQVNTFIYMVAQRKREFENFWRECLQCCSKIQLSLWYHRTWKHKAKTKHGLSSNCWWRRYAPSLDAVTETCYRLSLFNLGPTRLRTFAARTTVRLPRKCRQIDSADHPPTQESYKSYTCISLWWIGLLFGKKMSFLLGLACCQIAFCLYRSHGTIFKRLLMDRNKRL